MVITVVATVLCFIFPTWLSEYTEMAELNLTVLIVSLTMSGLVRLADYLGSKFFKDTET